MKLLGQAFSYWLKILALVLGLLSMSYIMLTARLYGFKEKKDMLARGRLYDCSVTFYWYIFSSLLYLFVSDFISYSTGLNFSQIYAMVMIAITVTIVVLLVIRIVQKRKKKRQE